MDHNNNVIYNWGYKAAYGGGRYGEINFVNNYYKPGPGTVNPRLFLEVSDDRTSRYYVAGNYIEGQPDITADNRLGVGGPNPEEAVVSTPFPTMPIDVQGPAALFKSVLAGAGCNIHRDSFDAAVVEQVRTGTAIWGENGFTDSPEQCGGYPVLKHRKPQKDKDRNGIPDRWERRHGSDIEEYINSLVK